MSTSNKVSEKVGFPRIHKQTILSRKLSFASKDISNTTKNNISLDQKIQSFMKRNLPININLKQPRHLIIKSADAIQMKSRKGDFPKFSSNINADGTILKPIYANAASQIGSSEYLVGTDIIENLTIPNIDYFTQNRRFKSGFSKRMT